MFRCLDGSMVPLYKVEQYADGIVGYGFPSQHGLPVLFMFRYSDPSYSQNYRNTHGHYQTSTQGQVQIPQPQVDPLIHQNVPTATIPVDDKQAQKPSTIFESDKDADKKAEVGENLVFEYKQEPVSPLPEDELKMAVVQYSSPAESVETESTVEGHEEVRGISKVISLESIASTTNSEAVPPATEKKESYLVRLTASMPDEPTVSRSFLNPVLNPAEPKPTLPKSDSLEGLLQRKLELLKLKQEEIESKKSPIERRYSSFHGDNVKNVDRAVNRAFLQTVAMPVADVSFSTNADYAVPFMTASSSKSNLSAESMARSQKLSREEMLKIQKQKKAELKRHQLHEAALKRNADRIAKQQESMIALQKEALARQMNEKVSEQNEQTAEDTFSTDIEVKGDAINELLNEEKEVPDTPVVSMEEKSDVHDPFPLPAPEWIPEILVLYENLGIRITNQPLSIHLQELILLDIHEVNVQKSAIISQLSEHTNPEVAIESMRRFIVLIYEYQPLSRSFTDQIKAQTEKMKPIFGKIHAIQENFYSRENQRTKGLVLVRELGLYIDQKTIRKHIRGPMNAIRKTLEPIFANFNFTFINIRRSYEQLKTMFPNGVPCSTMCASIIAETESTRVQLQSLVNVIEILQKNNIID